MESKQNLNELIKSSCFLHQVFMHRERLKQEQCKYITRDHWSHSPILTFGHTRASMYFIKPETCGSKS